MRNNGILTVTFIVVLLLGRVPVMWADEIDGFFETPTKDTVSQETAASPPVLDQYLQAQDKMKFSFNLNSVGGIIAGWTDTPDIDSLSSNLGHLSGTTIRLKSSLDLRPFDYFRLHGSFLLYYPTASGSTWDFSAPTLSELFFDYATPGLLSLRMGRYSIAWGNARILSAANLPGRTINVATLDPTVDIRPAWLESSNPSMWLKAALPLDRITLTGIAGLPGTVGTGLSAMGYGGLVEYVTGKTCLSLAGYYKSDKSPRLAFMVKTSGMGIDFFVDSSVSIPDFPEFSSPLTVVTGGLYYQTSSGPDIKVSAEIRYNGETVAGSGSLVADAQPIGGFSSAAVLAWTHVGGTPCTVGGTWYQSWEDGSGALVPFLSINIMPLVSIKAILPFVYGSDGSEYRETPPTEAAGFIAGFGLFVVLQTSF